jgi:hypothetical protein
LANTDLINKAHPNGRYGYSLMVGNSIKEHSRKRDDRFMSMEAVLQIEKKFLIQTEGV